MIYFFLGSPFSSGATIGNRVRHLFFQWSGGVHLQAVTTIFLAGLGCPLQIHTERVGGHLS